MATGPRYRVPFRRRREGKTDYHARRRMVISGRPRFVVRRTGTRIIVQAMQALPQGDRTLAFADSTHLAKFGWRGGTKNLPAAYLTGFLAGHLALKSGVSTAIADIGLAPPVPGSRLFAAIKGAIDAGLPIPCASKMFPPEERIRGEHIAAYAKVLSESDPERYKRQFNRILKRRVDLTKLPKHFETVKKKIVAKFSTRRSTSK